MSNWAVARGAGGIQLCSHTALNTPGTDYQWGAWVQLVSACPLPMSSLRLNWLQHDYQRTVLQLAIGASGSEQVIATIAAVHAYQTGSNPIGGRTYSLPLHVPAGARISARVFIPLSGWNQPWAQLSGTPAGALTPAGFSQMDAYGYTVGIGTAAARGTLLTAGTSAGMFNGTNGAWVEVVSSLSGAAAAVALGLGGLPNDLSSQPVMALGVGASGSEVEIATTSESVRWGDWPGETFSHVIPANIPAGSRLSLAVRSSYNVYQYDGILYVFR